MEKNRSLGVLLVGFGALLLLAQTNLIGGHFILYLIGLGFFTAYQFSGGKKNYGSLGFFIPGCVLVAIALFVDLERTFLGTMFGGGLFFLLLAAAFFTVYAYHTRGSNDQGSRNWPLYPAFGLFGFGLFVAFIDQSSSLERLTFINYIFPAALILAGFYLLYNNRKSQ